MHVCIAVRVYVIFAGKGRSLKFCKKIVAMLMGHNILPRTAPCNASASDQMRSSWQFQAGWQG